MLLEKTDFLAKIKSNNKIYLVGSNGKLSNPDKSKIELPFIFGKPDIKEFLKFKNIIDESKISYNQIKNLYYFRSGRWDLELENNILLKLPKDNIKVSLDNSFEFINYNSFLSDKTIDVRIKIKLLQMIEETNLKTYLGISQNKFEIYLFDTKSYRYLYEREIKIENEFTSINLNILSKFLEENVFNIEKLIGKFLNNICLIINSKEIVEINVGVKKLWRQN